MSTERGTPIYTRGSNPPAELLSDEPFGSCSRLKFVVKSRKKKLVDGSMAPTATAVAGLVEGRGC